MTNLSEKSQRPPAKKRRRGRPRLLQALQHGVEVMIFRLAMGVLRLLPLDAASALGGLTMRALGPLSGANRRAERNLRLVFPQMPAEERRRIIRAVWDNLGRVGAEYPHLEEIIDPEGERLVLENEGPARARLDAGQPIIMVSGHFANFEAMHIRAARELGKVVTVVREPNNRMIRDALEHFRKIGGGQRVGKGRQGARDLIRYLEQGWSVAMLVDQRLTRGIDTNFLGHPTTSPTAAAQLALRFRIPLAVAVMERRQGARFAMILSDLIWGDPEADNRLEIRRLVEEVNRQLEEAIRRRPQDWFWLHRRWSERVYKDAGL